MAHGLGDVKLFAAAGAWVGWQGLPSVLLIGAATGLAAAFLLTRAKGPRAERAGRLRALSDARAVDHLAPIHPIHDFEVAAPPERMWLAVGTRVREPAHGDRCKVTGVSQGVDSLALNAVDHTCCSELKIGAERRLQTRISHRIRLHLRAPCLHGNSLLPAFVFGLEQELRLQLAHQCFGK